MSATTGKGITFEDDDGTLVMGAEEDEFLSLTASEEERKKKYLKSVKQRELSKIEDTPSGENRESRVRTEKVDSKGDDGNGNDGNGNGDGDDANDSNANDSDVSSYDCKNAPSLQGEYDAAKCDENNLYASKKCNNFLLKKELIERSCLLEEGGDDDVVLYPNLNDENFNIKIADKEEFSNLRYDGTIYEDIELRAKFLSQQKFGTSPYQQFVKTFFSSQTPYNSLLLFHGVGSGKTCSAIGICEEFRDNTLRNVTSSKPILVVASKLLQSGFRKQLFDETKLVEDPERSGVWNINSCVGEKMLKEINPMNFAGLKKDEILVKINALIETNYEFVGYDELYNKIAGLFEQANRDESFKRKLMRKAFSNRIVVIDEVHNVTSTNWTKKKDKVDIRTNKITRRRITEQNEKNAASAISWVIQYAENIKLLMLTATPMYNSYDEIRWILNIMNKNDKRSIIGKNDITFDDDNILTEKSKEIIIRKSTGYVSVVRGENPYTFPYKIFPEVFSPENSFKKKIDLIPNVSMSGKEIPQKLRMRGILPIYLTYFDSSCSQQKQCNDCQYCIYKHIVERKKETTNDDGEADDDDGESQGEEEEEEDEEEEGEEKINLEQLRLPLNSLVMTYPNPNNNSGSSFQDLTGIRGLSTVMTNVGDKYRYIDDKFRLFQRKHIKKYSSKIYNVLESIQKTEADPLSEGVILIYAEHIEPAIIPMALALEEMGFRNIHGNILDASVERNKGNYTIIKGKVSQDIRTEDINKLTSKENKDGKIIKIVIISMTGAEGIDLKFIRQVHILEPWYNMSRNEQIIGRGVRQFSHQLLEFEKRNVQIFMYGMTSKDNVETADLLLYRHAERKAIQIGQISRLLKENAVDCILNHEQTQFTQDNMKKNVRQELSTGNEIEYGVGDIDNSSICDYMKCDYECNTNGKEEAETTNLDTYNVSFITINMNKILNIIRRLMREQFFYKRENLIEEINKEVTYPIIQIYSALNRLVDDETEYILDKYGRKGRLVNIDDYYFYQPEELNNPNISVFERSVPIDFKHEMLPFFTLSDDLAKKIETQAPDDVPKPLNVGEIVGFEKVSNSLKSKKIIITADEEEQLKTQYRLEYLDFEEKVKHMQDKSATDAVKNYFLGKKVGSGEGVIMLNNVYKYEYFNGRTQEKRDQPPYNFEESLRKKFKDVEFPRHINENNFKNKKDLLAAKAQRTVVADTFLPQFAKYIGFIGYKMKNESQSLVFKLKVHEEIFKTNCSGAACADKGRLEDIIIMINFVMKSLNPGADDVTENDIKTKQGETKAMKLAKPDLCLMLELLLRLCEMRKTGDKIWFLPPELALYFDLYRDERKKN
jgi:hypothetical protein